MDLAKKPAVFVFTTAYHPFIGGAEIAIQEIAKRLADHFRFSIVTARLKRELPTREVRPEGTITRIGFGSAFDTWLLLVLGAIAALREIRKVRPAPVVLWGVDISAGALAIAFVKLFMPRLPFVLNVQYGYGEERLASGRLGLIGLAFRFMLRRADAVTAISRHLAEVAHRFGWRGPIAVIPNGVDIQRFSVAHAERTSGSPPTVITVSRLVPKNGIDTLIRAIAEVRKSLPEIRCHILGGGPEQGSLQALTQSLGLAEAVTFFGDVPHAEVPRYLRVADLFVRPSRSEGMGNAFVEALASGLPIIGTPVGGVPDIIEGGTTGLFCRVDDPVDLAAKIQRLIADQNLSSRIVANGQKMVGERFSWVTIAHHYGDLFSKTLRPQPRILIATGIFPPDIGGPATYSQTLAEELTRRNFKVSILTYTGDAKLKIKSKKAKIQSKNQKYLIAKISRKIPKGLRHLWYFLRCLSLARSADIVYAQDPVSAGLPALFAAKLLRRTFAIRVAGDYAWEQSSQRFGLGEGIDAFQDRRYGFRTELLRHIQRLVVNRAAVVITPSEYFRKLVSGWVRNPTRVKRVYNGLNLREIVCPPDTERTPRCILSAGRLVPWKGFRTLIEFMPALPGWQLIIAGDGPEFGKLEILVEQLGLGDRVTLAGALSQRELLGELCRATVFVLNTSFESFSFQVVAAMAAGCPVITTTIGNLPEIIENGQDGILVEPDDRAAIVAAIEKITAEREFRNRIVSNARSRAQVFSIEETINELLRIFRGLPH